MDSYEEAKMIRWIEVMSASDVTSYPAFKQRILDFIRWHWDHKFQGTTLGHLNRRFGIKAVSFGTKTRNVLIELMKEKQIDLIDYRNSLVVIDSRYNEFLKPPEDEVIVDFNQAAALSNKKKANVLNASVGYVPPADPPDKK